MRKPNELLTSRARVRERYALIPLEGIPNSRLPEWPTAQVQVLAAPVIGSAFVEYLMLLPAGGRGGYKGDGQVETFLYVLSGEVTLSVEKREERLGAGGFALVPPTSGFGVVAQSETKLLVLRKKYEAADGIPMFAPLIGNERDVKGEVWGGDPGALLQTLIPDDFQYDIAMNIFTFEVGHGLPVVETHVMEHGLYVLQGKGLYFLGDDWMEVEATDFIWMGPYCPQSYYATGREATKYLYYKNVNREIAL
jgi:(S)-ureidoglycine aminohydrolase